MKSWSLAGVRSHLQKGPAAAAGHPESPSGTVISISPFPQPFFFCKEEQGQKNPGCFQFLAGQEVVALSMQRRLWELLAQSCFVKLQTRNRKLTKICSDPGLSMHTKPSRFSFLVQKMMIELLFSL